MCPPSSSSAECEIGTLAIKADFMALGDQYLTNLNCITHELTTEGNNLITELLQKVAEMEWKTDIHLNKMEVRVSSVVEKPGEATQTCLKRLNRKAPSSCKLKEMKRLKKDDGHDDQSPSHHEGEQKGEGVAAEAEATKTAETSKEPILHTEQTDPPAEASETPEDLPSSPPLYLSELPIEQRFNLPSTIKVQALFNLTSDALAILPKPRVSKHRSPGVSITKPIAEAPKAVQTSQAKTSDPFEELLKM